ncbi:murein DD-endopeptidase [Modicisalibacter xianhensis]|uniref:Murein DD-endopeptidase n=2 Tax=Modicisalibacter xianhensis TaxID=442341 RepID=A0A4R8G000_9GAMM|nr:murein DD-endopeptidase [Halomonas xianhensis]
MLRILHSLPRTHKLLILPVATMVTVLGTHKIISAFDTSGNHSPSLVAVNLPSVTLPADLQAHASTTSSVTTPPANTGKDAASDTLSGGDVTGQPIPLANLKARDIVDVSFLAKSDATDAEIVTPLKPAPVATDATAPSVKEAAKVDAQALHLAMQLPWNAPEAAEYEDIGGTSYEDLSADPLILNDGDIELEEELAANEVFVPSWETYTIQPGDTFAVMAERTLGLGYSEVLKLLDEMPEKKALTRWRVGDSFDFKLNETGDLLALRVMKNARTGYLIERNVEEKSFEVTSFEKTSQATERLFAGTVSGSFAQSASATGLSYAEVAELSVLLSKKLNFRRDTRRGDKFEVLVETDMIEGKATDSRILAAHYEGARMDLTVVRNSADDRFYTPDGHSLDPAFNRHPFNGSYRISSSFNLRRKHPITGRISPHRGTDFAMRTGSPVTSPAEGRVVKAAFQKNGAGNYLVIRHDNGYKTRYMHLSKRLVSEGDRVSMGQKIALSGNTGRSTGPHLHYEVMVNNSQVDPMRVKLPESKNLTGQALAAFKKESQQLLAKMDNDNDGTVVASRSASSNRPDGS